MSDDGDLVMWVVYDHPSDMPHRYVARKWLVGNNHAETPTSHIMATTDIGALRAMLEELGLVCLQRDPKDDPVIMEVWL